MWTATEEENLRCCYIRAGASAFAELFSLSDWRNISSDGEEWRNRQMRVRLRSHRRQRVRQAGEGYAARVTVEADECQGIEREHGACVRRLRLADGAGSARCGGRCSGHGRWQLQSAIRRSGIAGAVWEGRNPRRGRKHARLTAAGRRGGGDAGARCAGASWAGAGACVGSRTLTEERTLTHVQSGRGCITVQRATRTY